MRLMKLFTDANFANDDMSHINLLPTFFLD